MASTVCVAHCNAVIVDHYNTIGERTSVAPKVAVETPHGNSGVSRTTAPNVGMPVVSIVHGDAKRSAVSPPESTHGDASVDPNVVSDPRIESSNHADPGSDNTSPKSAVWNIARYYIVGNGTPPKHCWSTIYSGETTRGIELRGVVVDDGDPSAKRIAN